MGTVFNEVPKIDNQYVCVVNKKNTILGAVISSYFNEPGTYFPIFAFPDISISDFDGDSFEEDGYIARGLGSEFGILINNALARMRGCKFLILAGLNEHQKTYLRIPRSTQVIEVNSIDEVKVKLAQIIGEREVLECKSEDILSALFVAKSTGKVLAINETASHISLPPLNKGKGIIVLERNQESFSVVAVNFACSVNANLFVVDKFGREERGNIERRIQKWRKNGSYNQLQKVIDKVLRRIGGLDFAGFRYATFFTEGLPYSLGIRNIIPCSYVHLALRPDFFVFNSIIFESIERFDSAVIFAPGYFRNVMGGEETEALVDFFRNSRYHVRSLTGRLATVRNLDFHAQYFPYDVLHICTHGGEVDGYSVKEEFFDRDGKKHTVEYDEVVGFAPVPGTEMVQLHRKVIFKKFDDFNWMSHELRKQNYPSTVYEDMRKSLFRKEESGKKLNRVQKDVIPTSCAISCIDSIHQGMFRILASHSSPFVFNNACWSWSEVAVFFLAGGARGYIGTLWDIGNDTAVVGAKSFYENLFEGTALEAFFHAIKAIRNTSSPDIYVFWGLHFSTLKPSGNMIGGRKKVFKELVRSFYLWSEKVESTKSSEIQRNSLEVVESIFEDIINNFTKEDMETLSSELKDKMSGLVKEETSTRDFSKQEILLQDTLSLEMPTEVRRVKRKT